MAEAFKPGILDLIAKILANTLRILAALKHARAVPARALQSVLDRMRFTDPLWDPIIL